jgi:hypothetical protein
LLLTFEGILGGELNVAAETASLTEAHVITLYFVALCRSKVDQVDS